MKVSMPLFCDLPHHILCFDDDDAFLGAGGFSANYSCHVVGWLGRLLGWLVTSLEMTLPPLIWSILHCSERYSVQCF